MHNRSEWLRGSPGPKTIKGREYKNLVEFSRKCQTCEAPFSIYVTSKIAAGHADSNSFGLKNCPDHRRNKTGAQGVEVEQLRMANNIMRQELEGLYARDKDLFAENQALKARLATYELQGAMATFGGVPALTFPWDAP